MKKLLIIAVVCFVLTQSVEVAALVILFGAIHWVLKKMGLLSAPTRMSNAAGNAVRRGYNRSVIRDEIRRSFWR